MKEKGDASHQTEEPRREEIHEEDQTAWRGGRNTRRRCPTDQGAPNHTAIDRRTSAESEENARADEAIGDRGCPRAAAGADAPAARM